MNCKRMFRGRQPIRNSLTISVPQNKKPERIDIFLARQIGNMSRSQLKKLIIDDDVLVDGKSVRPSYLVDSGEIIEITISAPPPIKAEPEDIPLDIAFEDESLIVVNKSAGIVIHPARGNLKGTLVNALLHYSDSISTGSDPFRPGIVHRLDKGTSGLIMIAKNDQVHAEITNMFMNREIVKEYTALIWGMMPQNEGKISEPIGRSRKDRTKMSATDNGKSAVTNYKVDVEMDFTSLIRLKPVTGRTHQLRVHLSNLGMPIFGDHEYGGRGRMAGMVTPERRKKAVKALELLSRQALHARRLSFRHPVTKKQIEIEAPLPDDILSVLELFEISKYQTQGDSVGVEESD